MSSTTYRLESFRPWKPSQEKEQPLRDRIGICRYPSPVSISTTLSSSNLSNPVSQRLDLYAPGSKQHPLPIRPPAEVCFNGDSQLNAQITRHGPEILERPSPMNPNCEAFDFEDSLYPDDPPNPGDDDSAMTFEQIVPDFEHQPLTSTQVARTSFSLLISTLNMGFLKALWRPETFPKVRQLTRQSWTIIIAAMLSRPKQQELLLLLQPCHAESQLNTLALWLETPFATTDNRLLKGP